MTIPDITTRGTRTRALRRVLMLGVLATLLTGCGETTFGFTIVNDLDESVRITRILVETQTSLERPSGGEMLDPGEEQTFFLNYTWDPVRKRDCQAIDVLAQGDEGVIVAKIASPVCLDDRIALSSVLVP